MSVSLCVCVCVCVCVCMCVWCVCSIPNTTALRSCTHIFVSSYCHMCVLILLYMCPHTALHLRSCKCSRIELSKVDSIYERARIESLLALALSYARIDSILALSNIVYSIYSIYSIYVFSVFYSSESPPDSCGCVTQHTLLL
jgi:hypothetical protein